MSATREVLITGAAGFVAQRVAVALAKSGVRVTGLDRAALPEPAGGNEADPAFAAFIRCDLLDDAALAQLSTRRFDAIVHLAGVLPGKASRGELFAVNAGGTSAVLERLARRGNQVVLLSTGLVYGPQTAPFNEQTPCMPAEPYGQSKLAAETLVRSWARAMQSPAVVLRPSVIYGPGAPATMLLVSLLAALRAREPFAMTAGEQLRDFVHVDDAAAAVAAAIAQRADGTFNLASGESHTVRAAAELAARIAGRPELLRVGALPYRDAEVFDYRLDNTAIRRALGWEPRITLEAGLKRRWEEMA